MILVEIWEEKGKCLVIPERINLEALKEARWEIVKNYDSM
jgi:hypothetical protein